MNIIAALILLFAGALALIGVVQAVDLPARFASQRMLVALPFVGPALGLAGFGMILLALSNVDHSIRSLHKDLRVSALVPLQARTFVHASHQSEQSVAIRWRGHDVIVHADGSVTTGPEEARVNFPSLAEFDDTLPLPNLET
ncbi:MAG: hypothetical protein AAGM04_03855 [Pseudomonadota bacterium]